MNSKWCEPEPLELQTDYCQPDGKERFDFCSRAGIKFGDGAIIEKGSDKGNYGFRVFRRGRLIMQHAKIGF